MFHYQMQMYEKKANPRLPETGRFLAQNVNLYEDL
jgi:hypothetical protein